MKKLALIVTAITMAITVNAQTYRGFFDISAGFGTTKGLQYAPSPNEKISESKLSAMAGISTSHGFQSLPFLYTGLGLGLYVPFYHGTSLQSGLGEESNTEINGLCIPVFANLRWDLNIRSKCTPYVGVKIGYQMGLVIDEGPVADTYLSWDDNGVNGNSQSMTYMRPGSGFYFEPSVGMRIRKGDRSGFNIGLSYNPTINTECEVYNGYKNEGSNVRKLYSAKKKFGALMFTFGMDF